MSLQRNIKELKEAKSIADYMVGEIRERGKACVGFPGFWLWPPGKM